jgi:hypothetical protein
VAQPAPPIAACDAISAGAAISAADHAATGLAARLAERAPAGITLAAVNASIAPAANGTARATPRPSVSTFAVFARARA